MEKVKKTSKLKSKNIPKDGDVMFARRCSICNNEIMQSYFLGRWIMDEHSIIDCLRHLEDRIYALELERKADV